MAAMRIVLIPGVLQKGMISDGAATDQYRISTGSLQDQARISIGNRKE